MSVESGTPGSTDPARFCRSNLPASLQDSRRYPRSLPGRWLKSHQYKCFDSAIFARGILIAMNQWLPLRGEITEIFWVDSDLGFTLWTWFSMCHKLVTAYLNEQNYLSFIPLQILPQRFKSLLMFKCFVKRKKAASCFQTRYFNPSKHTFLFPAHLHGNDSVCEVECVSFTL